MIASFFPPISHLPVNVAPGSIASLPVLISPYTFDMERSDNNSVTIGYDYALSGEKVFKKAAIELCKKMNWDTNLLGGGTKNGYVFVFKNQ